LLVELRVAVAHLMAAEAAEAQEVYVMALQLYLLEIIR
jgi:hypothetical protein